MYGKKELTLAIDFDGVIHDYVHPIKGRRMGEPIAGAKEALDRYKAFGHTVIVHSVWAHDEGIKTIADWMKFYNIPYTSITNVKPRADVYLDDKAERFISWDQVKLL